jgi:hypothetical protein
MIVAIDLQKRSDWTISMAESEIIVAISGGAPGEKEVIKSNKMQNKIGRR